VLDIAALAREHGPAAIQTLVACLRDPRHKIAAAQALLDRGFGRPAQTIIGDTERPVAIDFTWQPAAESAVPQTHTPITQSVGSNVMELVWETVKEDE
jgi:hypothetical protein